MLRRQLTDRSRIGGTVSERFEALAVAVLNVGSNPGDASNSKLSIFKHLKVSGGPYDARRHLDSPNPLW